MSYIFVDCEAPLSAQDQWKYDHWKARFERRYGRPVEEHEGAEGTLYGVKII